MNFTESTVIIKKEHIENIINVLKQFAVINRTRWVSGISECETIEEIFDEIRYPLCQNSEGDYEIDDFSGEKLGDDLKIFNSFAKYIEDGQYIEMCGEDGNQWRWRFKNGICEEIHPTISWE